MNQLTGTRRSFLKSLGLGIAFVGLGGCEGVLSHAAGPVLSKKRHLERKDKPNVIIVLTDDQGYGDLSCHGLSLIHISEPTRPY